MHPHAQKLHDANAHAISVLTATPDDHAAAHVALAARHPTPEHQLHDEHKDYASLARHVTVQTRNIAAVNHMDHTAIPAVEHDSSPHALLIGALKQQNALLESDVSCPLFHIVQTYLTSNSWLSMI